MLYNINLKVDVKNTDEANALALKLSVILKELDIFHVGEVKKAT